MDRRFQSPLLGLDLSGRSPFSAKSMIGLPPAHFTPPVVKFIAGQPTVKGTPLATNNKPAQDYLWNPPGNNLATGAVTGAQAGANSGSTYNAQYYGDGGGFPVVLAAGIPQLVLKRPAKTRVELLIQNLNAAGNIAYAFDGAPSMANSINIGPGGNRLFDSAVPQNDLWLISAVNSVVAIEFINKDLTSGN